MRRLMMLLTMATITQLNVIAAEDSPMKPDAITCLVEAIKAMDSDGFRTCLTTDFAATLDQDTLDGILQAIGPRLKSNYTITHLGSLRQDEHTVEVTKLAIADGDEDVMIRSIHEGGRIAGLLVTRPFE